MVSNMERPVVSSGQTHDRASASMSLTDALLIIKDMNYLGRVQMLLKVY